MNDSVRRPRRWRRLLLALILLAVATRLALPWVLPAVLDRVAASFGLEARWERLDLALFSGELEIHHLVVAERGTPGPEPPDPLLDLEFAAVNADVSALFRGHLRVERFEIDGLDARLERESDGSLTLARLWASDSDPAKPAPPPPREEAQPGPIALDLPVQVDALRLQHVSVRVVDHSVTPTFDETFELTARVSDLGSSERRTRLSLFASCPGVLDALEVQGSGSSGGRTLGSQLDLHLTGLHPKRLTSQLARLGIAPRAEEIHAQLAIEARMEPRPEDERTGRGRIEVGPVRVTADLREEFGLDRARLDLPRVGADRIELGEASLEGLHGRSARLANGHLVVAGLELGPRPASEPEPDEPPDSAGRSRLPRIDLREARLTEASLSFHDEAVTPAADTEIAIESVRIGPLALFARPGDPAEEAAATAIEAQLAAPGIAERLHASGRLVGPGGRKELELKLSADGLAPERARPYLAAAGLRSSLSKGSLDLTLEGWFEPGQDGLHGGLELRDLELADGEPLFALKSAALRDVAFDPSAARLSVEAVEVTGLDTGASRDAEGTWHALGLTLPPQPAVARAPSPSREATGTRVPSASTPGATASALPHSPARALPAAAPAPAARTGGLRVELGRLAFTGSRIALSDHALAQPFDLVLDDFGAVVTDLALGGPPGAGGTAEPARAQLWLRAEGLADELSLEGTLACGSAPLEVDADLVLRGRGIAPSAFAPWLAAAGLESQLDSGRLDARLTARVRAMEEGLAADAAVHELTLEDRDRELCAVDELALKGLQVSPLGLAAESVVVRGPRLRLARDSAGKLSALGMRWSPPDSASASAAASEGAPAAAAPPPAAAAPSSEPPAPARSFALARLSVEDARVDWNDAWPQQKVELTARARAEVSGFSFGPGAAPATVELGASVEGALDELSLSGTAALRPGSAEADLALDLIGVRAGPLAVYLPETVGLGVTDGRLHADLRAAIEPAEAGGSAARAELSNVRWSDGSEDTALLSFERLVARAPRLDSAARHYEVDELSLVGLGLDSRWTQDQTFEVAGVVLRPAAPSAAPADPSAAPEPSPPPGPDRDAPDSTAAGPPASGRRSYPTVTLGHLDLGLERLAFTDELDPGATPAEGRLRLRTTQPVTLSSEDPEAQPPIELLLEGSFAPLVDSVEIAVSARPWTPDPQVAAWWLARGLHGAELTRIAPELADRLDASRLSDGRIEGRLDGVLRWRRRGPMDFDLSNGFGLELNVLDLALRPTPFEDPVGGLDELHVDVAHVAPTGAVHVKSIELVKPRGRARQLPGGLEVCGVLLKSGQDADTPATTSPRPGASERGAGSGADPAPPDPVAAIPEGKSESAPAGATPPVQDSVGAAEPSQAARPQPAETAGSAPRGNAPAPELRIDSFVADEVDFVFRDETVAPPMVLPLADLHVQLRRFTTRAFTERRAVRFRAYVGAGAVEMPVRDPSHVLSGQTVKNVTGTVTGTAANVLTLGRAGAPTRPPRAAKTEMRPLFDEIAVSGNLVFHPALEGWIKAQVSSLELASVRGRAADAGVSVRDGVLDSTVSARLRGRKGIDVRSRSTFSWLDVSEPENGFLSRTLNLSVPVDTAIFLLRDANGEIHLPVDFSVGQTGLQGVGAAATSAVASVLASAIASSPLRVANTATDIATLGGSLTGWLGLGKKRGNKPVAQVEVGYEPGVPVPEASELAKLEPLIARMHREDDLALVLEHVTGAGDLERAALLSSPSPEDAMALAARLRLERARARGERDRLAAEVRALFATGRDEAGQGAADKLRNVEKRLGETEAALDSVYELLRPGAERRQRSRARRAAVAIAEKRLLELKRVIALRGHGAWDERIEVRTPRARAAETTGGGAVRVTARHRR